MKRIRLWLARRLLPRDHFIMRKITPEEEAQDFW